MAINAPTTIADPVLGQTGGVGALKWSGDAQVEIRDEVRQVMRGSERNQTQVLVREIVAHIPSTVPVTIAENDILTLAMLTGETLQLQVRMRDQTFWALGFYRYTLRYP